MLYFYSQRCIKEREREKLDQCTYCVLIVCKTLLLLLRWDTGKDRDRFGGIGRFKGKLIK